MIELSFMIAHRGIAWTNEAAGGGCEAHSLYSRKQKFKCIRSQVFLGFDEIYESLKAERRFKQSGI